MPSMMFLSKLKVITFTSKSSEDSYFILLGQEEYNFHIAINSDTKLTEWEGDDGNQIHFCNAKPLIKSCATL